MAKKPVSKKEIEEFGVNLTWQCETHDAWLTVIRFGLQTFLQNQALLFELIWREAVRQLERGQTESNVAEQARIIFDELHLRIE